MASDSPLLLSVRLNVEKQCWLNSAYITEKAVHRDNISGLPVRATAPPQQKA